MDSRTTSYTRWIRLLFDESFDDILTQARIIAYKYSDIKDNNAYTISASPIILTGACTTQPPCRHCKWEHFKVTKRSPFIHDMTSEQAVERAHTLVVHGIQRAFMATGWMGYRLPAHFINLVAAIHDAEPGLELYGLFGALDHQSHRDLASAGMTGMLCSLESPNTTIYWSFRPGGDSLDDRLHSLDYAREEGLKIWSGFLVGLGETADDCTYGISILQTFEPESISILPFEPYPDTPMADYPPTDAHWLARVNAVARIALPDVKYFFTDHAASFQNYDKSLAMNGSYETRIP